MAKTAFFEKLGSSYALNRTGEDTYRFSALKPSAAIGFSQELTKKEVEQMLTAFAEAFLKEPEAIDTERADAVAKALREYAESQSTTIESIDRAVSDGRFKSREAWLAEQLGAEDLEEVVAGKLSVQEALDNNTDVDDLEEDAA